MIKLLSIYLLIGTIFWFTIVVCMLVAIKLKLYITTGDKDTEKKLNEIVSWSTVIQSKAFARFTAKTVLLWPVRLLEVVFDVAGAISRRKKNER